MTRTKLSTITALVCLLATSCGGGGGDSEKAASDAGRAGRSETQTPACQPITADTTLTQDLGPCPDNGLVVRASGTPTDKLTINLNGHKVIGTCDGANPGAGVLIESQSWVEVKGPGTVECFASGVFIKGVVTRPGQSPERAADNNTVSGLTVRKNIGHRAERGDGIALSAANENTVCDNTVAENGPIAGITLFHGSSRNTICRNTVSNNNVERSPGTNDDIGIRLENRSNNNTVRENTVTGSGLEGISNFADAQDNDIVGNRVIDNGKHEKVHRKGDGIRVFVRGDRVLVSGNTVCANAASGIRVDSKDNNASNGGGIINNIVGTGPRCSDNHGANVANTFELHDTTAAPSDNAATNCGTNEWRGNRTHAPGAPNHALSNPCVSRA